MDNKEVEVKGGSLEAILNNTNTTSTNNLLNSYKEDLDQFAKALVDMSNTYIENDNGSYVYGTDAVSINKDEDKKVSIDLYSGSDIKTLKFNDEKVYSLSQEKLDYLSKIQWKTDVDFDGTGENKSSFSGFYQSTRFKIADNRENIIFKKENEAAIKESLQSSYDKVTKVDKDEEMLDLIKFQAAYSANAKVITTLNEMLQTLLNLKR
jgi:flagellar hook-associated protein 1 FlgK